MDRTELRIVSDTFGERLVAARKQKHLTQAALAARIGTRPTTISRWETDVVAPRIHHRIALAAALEVPLRDLLPAPPAARGPLSPDVA
jgi:transcriptional regulator with XRE-family HTH domain